jgi:hypothetical protein
MLKGQFPGVNFMFQEDVMYIIGERVQAPTLGQGQQRTRERKAAGSLQHVLRGF